VWSANFTPSFSSALVAWVVLDISRDYSVFT